ncbi:hypothetical protein Taro_052353 [Colocasia esculenta]|uniref:Uncharacterized protein n=1 Tax=Colocasia esculenta TaxID=4460 RepID=A0A843XJG8_COLES|nr:hypothetical protein [Colocasia esculenta]
MGEVTRFRGPTGHRQSSIDFPFFFSLWP